MRKRDKKSERREILKALSLIMQLGLSMMVCMGISLGIGYYIDRLFQTRFGILVMMIIGILASLRSMLVLTGAYTPGKKRDGSRSDPEEEEKDENRKD